MRFWWPMGLCHSSPQYSNLKLFNSTRFPSSLFIYLEYLNVPLTKLFKNSCLELFLKNIFVKGRVFLPVHTIWIHITLKNKVWLEWLIAFLTTLLTKSFKNLRLFVTVNYFNNSSFKFWNATLKLSVHVYTYAHAHTRACTHKHT